MLGTSAVARRLWWPVSTEVNRPPTDQDDSPSEGGKIEGGDGHADRNEAEERGEGDNDGDNTDEEEGEVRSLYMAPSGDSSHEGENSGGRDGSDPLYGEEDVETELVESDYDEGLFGDWDLGLRYKPTAIVGEGTFGHVAIAEDLIEGGSVAIKRVGNPFERKRRAKYAYRELSILRHINHKNVVGLRDVIVPRDEKDFHDLYLVLERMDSNLAEMMHLDGFWSVKRVQQVLLEIVVAVRQLHAANVIHRDIKPSNILANEMLQVRVCDFGLSRALTPEDRTGGYFGLPRSACSGASRPEAGRKLERKLTPYVGTAWYSAPELVLQQV